MESRYNKLKRKVRRIAYKVRVAVEWMAKDEDYDRPEHDMNESDTLSGYCGRASAMLSYELNRARLKHRIAYGCGHMYVIWDEHIIDVTATQFGDYFGKTIVRRPESLKKLCERNDDASEFGTWETSKLFDTIHQAREWQIDNDWPDEQMIEEVDFEYLR